MKANTAYKGNYKKGQKVKSTLWKEISPQNPDKQFHPTLTIVGFEAQEWMGERMFMVTVTDGIRTADVWEDTLFS